VAKMPRMFSK